MSNTQRNNITEHDLPEDILSADFTDGDEQNFIGYAKIFAFLKELKYLKSDKIITNQTAK